MIKITLFFQYPQKIWQKPLTSPRDLMVQYICIITGLFRNLIANPVSAVAEGNYLGILFWSIIIGLALKKFAGEATCPI